MRILETIAQTLRTARAHPTDVLNALIELENAGGSAALMELEYRIARLVRAMRERGDANINVAQAWLNTTRLYLEEHAQMDALPAATVTRQTTVHAKVLSAFAYPHTLLRSA
jgi:hypothetical protein